MVGSRRGLTRQMNFWKEPGAASETRRSQGGRQPGQRDAGAGHGLQTGEEDDGTSRWESRAEGVAAH